MKNYSLPNIIIRKNKCIEVGISALVSFNGKYNGKKICWDRWSYNKRLEINERNNFPHGRKIKWYSNGIMEYYINYRYGKRHGKSYEWYFNNIRQSESNWLNSKKHGKEIKWRITGCKEFEIEWKYGKAISVNKYYDQKNICILILIGLGIVHWLYFVKR